MKKPVLIIVAVIAVAALLLPPVLGSMTESQVNTHIAKFDENPVIAISVDSYDKGWFSSSAKVSVGIDSDYANMLMGTAQAGAAQNDGLDFDDGDTPWIIEIMNERMVFDLDIGHGPIGFFNGPFLGFAKLLAQPDQQSEMVQEIQTTLGIPYLMQLRGQTSLFGAFNFDGDIPAVAFSDETGQLSMAPVTVEGTSRGNHLVANGGIDHMEFDVVDGSATVDGLRFQADGNRVNQLIWTGDFGFFIDTVQAADRLAGTGASFTANDFYVTTESSVNNSGELLMGSIRYGAASAESAADDIRIDDPVFGFRFENISVDALTEYYETIMAMDGTDPNVAVQAMQTIGAEILLHAPVVAIDPIAFVMDGQPFTAKLEIRTNAEAAQNGIDLSNPMMLAFLFEASASATASKSLVTSIAAQTVAQQLSSAGLDPSTLPQGQDVEAMAEAQAQFMLASFLGQGYIVDNGDTYSTEIEYAAGQILVNGSPLPLGALF